MRILTGFVLFCSLLAAPWGTYFTASAQTPGQTPGAQAPAQPQVIPQDPRWVYFSYDSNQQGIRYYYDKQTVAYLSDNRVRVWLKAASPAGEELIQTEIECAGGMFRTIQPYKPLIGKGVKTSYAEYGWLDITPGSEVDLMKKIVCKPKR